MLHLRVFGSAHAMADDWLPSGFAVGESALRGLGVAAGVGEAGKAAVLGVNVAMLTFGGSTALLIQRSLARRAAARMAGP